MVRRNVVVLSCHGVVWAAAILLALWAGGVKAVTRYNTATPHTPSYTAYKYIPIHSNYEQFSSEEATSSPDEDSEPTYRMPPSEMILTALRTALDVVRNINKKKSNATVISNPPHIQLRKTNARNRTSAQSGRGFEDYYDEHHYHDTTTTTTPKPMKQGRYTDPWAGYYDWIINEGSFKFWSVFQLFTAALLLYACLSAIYYAKFNPIIPDYDREYDDYFLERTVGRNARSLSSWELPSGLSWINPRTFQFILDAISKHYEEE